MIKDSWEVPEKIRDLLRESYFKLTDLEYPIEPPTKENIQKLLIAVEFEVAIFNEVEIEPFANPEKLKERLDILNRRLHLFLR